jgi:hypothetical protein
LKSNKKAAKFGGCTQKAIALSMAKKFRHKHIACPHTTPSFIALLFGRAATAAALDKLSFFLFSFSKMFCGAQRGKT